MTKIRKEEPEKIALPGKEKLEGRENQEELPPFPGSEKDSSPISSRIEKGGSPETELTDADILEPCRNLIAAVFDIWRLFKPAVEPLNETEKDLLGKPLSRIVYKNDWTRYAKDEILFGILLLTVVLPRIKQSKEIKEEEKKT